MELPEITTVEPSLNFSSNHASGVMPSIVPPPSGSPSFKLLRTMPRSPVYISEPLKPLMVAMGSGPLAWATSGGAGWFGSCTSALMKNPIITSAAMASSGRT